MVNVFTLHITRAYMIHHVLAEKASNIDPADAVLPVNLFLYIASKIKYVA